MLREAWTPSDDALLAEVYAAWPPRYELLPDRTRGAMHQHAYRLGLAGRRQIDQPFLGVSQLDWAYFAGIVDGEGSIGIYCTGRVRATTKVRLTVVNTDRPLIDWIVSRFPGGSVQKYEPIKPNRKVLWHVRYCRMDLILAVLDGLRPYLIIKAEKADEVMKYITTRPKFTALT